MNQPTPVTVHHVPGQGTTYHVAGLTFTRPKDACRAADAFDRGITVVSPLRSGSDSDLTATLGSGVREGASGSERRGFDDRFIGSRMDSPPSFQASGASKRPASGNAVQAGAPPER